MISYVLAGDYEIYRNFLHRLRIKGIDVSGFVYISSLYTLRGVSGRDRQVRLLKVGRWYDRVDASEIITYAGFCGIALPKGGKTSASDRVRNNSHTFTLPRNYMVAVDGVWLGCDENKDNN